MKLLVLKWRILQLYSKKNLIDKLGGGVWWIYRFYESKRLLTVQLYKSIFETILEDSLVAQLKNAIQQKVYLRPRKVPRYNIRIIFAFFASRFISSDGTFRT